MLTDSKSLLDVFSKGSRTSDRRLMIDDTAAREGYQNKDGENIGFVHTELSLAPGVT